VIEHLKVCRDRAVIEHEVQVIGLHGQVRATLASAFGLAPSTPFHLEAADGSLFPVSAHLPSQQPLTLVLSQDETEQGMGAVPSPYFFFTLLSSHFRVTHT
jgi:hypothetical protein